VALQKDITIHENNAKVPALWGWHTYVSLGITAAILILLALWVDLRDMWHHFANSNKVFLFMGAVAHYATYPVRGLRWRRCLIHLPLKTGKGKFGLLVFFYNFVDNLVPAKLGDVYGAHLARINFGIRRSSALGSIVFLRMVDAWIVLMLASLASWVLFAARLPRSVLWALIGGGMIAVAASSLMLFFFAFKKSLPGWLPEKLQQMIQAFHTGMWPRPRELMPIALLTLIIWALETVWILFLILAFGQEVGLAEVIFLTMVPLLASAFPFTPSGAGVVELTLFSCLRVVGMPVPMAVSVTAANRVIDYWLHIGLGMLTWAIRQGIGLKTWREVPLKSSKLMPSPLPSFSQEMLRES
jgi:uncharacterized protein (TIRG00374 family)